MLFIVVGTIIVVPIVRATMILRLRRSKRHNTAYETRYTWANKTITGTLLDLNCHGTKLRHQLKYPLPKGESIDIAILDDWCGGTVMWSNAHYSGIKFKSAIDLEIVHAVCDQDITQH